MHFLARREAESLEKKLRLQIADMPRPKLTLHYERGDRDYFKAAEAGAGSIGAFDEAMLLFPFCITGDEWNESNAGHECRHRCRHWRNANGEQRRP